MLVLWRKRAPGGLIVVHRSHRPLADCSHRWETIAQDDGIHAVVVEEGYEVRGFTTDIESFMAAARHQNHCRARV